MRRTGQRQGLTLVELLVGIMVTAMIAAALATVTYSVENLTQVAGGLSDVTQHARVSLSVVERSIGESHASGAFPGMAVFSVEVNGSRYPDTLVVWRPDGPPADPTGLPLFSEVVVFTPHPQSPRQLLQIEDRSDIRTVPPLDDEVSWLSELHDLRTRLADSSLVLTDRMRVAKAGDGTLPQRRAAVRFFVESRPSFDEFQRYQAGLLNWDQLSWPLALVDRDRGVARTRCSIELQLAAGDGADDVGIVVFLGTASTEFVVERADLPVGNVGLPVDLNGKTMPVGGMTP